MRLRGSCVALLIGVVVAGQVGGLCEAVCALTGSHHASMLHAGHAAPPAMGDTSTAHGEHVSSSEDHPVMQHGGPAATHCPVCSGPGPCSMMRSPVSIHGAVPADRVPAPALLVARSGSVEAPAIGDIRVESLAAPPEAQPPRG